MWHLSAFATSGNPGPSQGALSSLLAGEGFVGPRSIKALSDASQGEVGQLAEPPWSETDRGDGILLGNVEGYGGAKPDVSCETSVCHPPAIAPFLASVG
jgi:hypothetical protein